MVLEQQHLAAALCEDVAAGDGESRDCKLTAKDLLLDLRGER